MKRLVLVLLAVTTGCAGIDYVNDEYPDVLPVRSSYGDRTFNIFEHADRNRALVTPTFGASFASGATFGGTSSPQVHYERAVQAYLASTGRRCVITKSQLVLKPNYEVFYQCD
ncbi:hypothetical protein SAMN05444404_3194 [Ruegeria lacuscaerulensis ITI-1157]|nr:hypothetical protein SAMN05444404_3194 [Ruegeria lacuscaerulensis ITI-1157]